MSILERISRIARANIHNALDKADPPELELRERIRELEETTQEAKEALASYAVSYKKMERETDELCKQRDAMQEKAEASLKAGDEDKARVALAERIKHEERLSSLQPSLERSRTTYEELKQNLVKLNDNLNAARLKLTELESRKRAAEAQRAFGAKLDEAAASSDGDVSFSRLEDQVLETEATAEIEAEVRAELRGSGEALKQEAEEKRVDDALAALKKELGGGGS